MGFLTLADEVHRLGLAAERAFFELLGLRRDLPPSHLTWHWLRRRSRARVAALRLVRAVDRATRLNLPRQSPANERPESLWTTAELATAPLERMHAHLQDAFRARYLDAWLIDDFVRQRDARFAEEHPREDEHRDTEEGDDERFWEDLSRFGDELDEVAARRELESLGALHELTAPFANLAPWNVPDARRPRPGPPPSPGVLDAFASFSAQRRPLPQGETARRLILTRGLQGPIVTRADLTAIWGVP